MKLEFKKFDSITDDFDKRFSIYQDEFYSILSQSYPQYYGLEYHKARIMSGKSIIYLGFADSKLVAVSYVKRNLRRGSTAVFPVEYRRLGIAEQLVRLSFIDFPKQYTILSTNYDYSFKMLSLLKNLGFEKATNKALIKKLAIEEYKFLSNFKMIDGYFVFDRESSKRGTKREQLTLLYKL